MKQHKIRQIVTIGIVLLLTGTISQGIQIQKQTEHHETIELIWGLSTIYVGAFEIYGTIKDPQYRPIPNVTLTLFGGPLLGPGGLFKKVTGENGYTSFPGRVTGNYLLIASKQGYTDISSGIKGFKILNIGAATQYTELFIFYENSNLLTVHTEKSDHSNFE